MNVIVADDYGQMSKLAATEVIRLMKSYNDPLLCTASGDSPAGLYKELVDEYKNGKLNVTRWNFVALDEWVGLNGNDEGSCRFHLDHQLFNPLTIDAHKIHFFDGKATDSKKECEVIDQYIRQQDGIDVVILGLGMNGHIGMNEPGSSEKLRSHVAELDPITQQTGQKYFKKQQELKGGITLGLATIMESKNIILLVSGAHKAPIVKKMIEGEISATLPGSLLRRHPQLKIYLDKASASLLAS